MKITRSCKICKVMMFETKMKKTGIKIFFHGKIVTIVELICKDCVSKYLRIRRNKVFKAELEKIV